MEPSLAFTRPRFQSTLPVWGGTTRRARPCNSVSNFNPPSPCGEGPGGNGRRRHRAQISIHPPRVGRDCQRLHVLGQGLISIHPPRVGRDFRAGRWQGCCWIFQSTLPVWGGTRRTYHLPASCTHFNPPSPCGEGPDTPRLYNDALYFNPPSPCGEGQIYSASNRERALFQSTLPVWGGTMAQGEPVFAVKISIHPPRVGRDVVSGNSNCVLGSFQSTLPVWGGTPPPAHHGIAHLISIHPPRVGRDISALSPRHSRRDFNPPSPCGEGPLCWATVVSNQDFNPPSPCGEGQAENVDASFWHGISIHPPRVGRDQKPLFERRVIFISIHPPRVGRDECSGSL